MKKADHFISRITNILCWLGEAVIIIMMFSICADVLCRTLFNRPIMGIPDMMSAFLPLIVFLVIPACTREGQHVRATMIVDRLPITGQRAMELFANLVGAAFFIVLIYACWRPMIAATEIRQYVGTSFKIPVFPIYYLIEIGSAVCVYYTLKRLVEIAKEIKGKLALRAPDDEQSGKGKEISVHEPN